MTKKRLRYWRNVRAWLYLLAFVVLCASVSYSIASRHIVPVLNLNVIVPGQEKTLQQSFEPHKPSGMTRVREIGGCYDVQG